MADQAADTVDTGVDNNELPTSDVEGDAVKPEGSEPQAGADTPEGDEPSQDQTPEWAKKRFGELTAQREAEKRLREAAEIERETLRKLLLEQRPGQKVEDPKPAPTPEQTVAPKVEDFDDYGQYIDAVVAFQVNSALSEREEANSAASTQEQLQTRFATAAETFKKTTQDYDQVVNNPAFGQSPALLQALFNSDMGPQIAYHLGRNLAEVQRLNQLPLVAVAKEIGRLEEKLTPPKPRVVPKAPDPIKPVGGNATDKAVKDPKDMTMNEYAEHRAGTVAWKGRKR